MAWRQIGYIATQFVDNLFAYLNTNFHQLYLTPAKPFRTTLTGQEGASGFRLFLDVHWNTFSGGQAIVLVTFVH